MKVLSLKNVVKKYHNHTAVDDVSFDVERGTIFGLLGPNGAGKTSLIRIITTITAADSGQVFLNGEPLNHLHPNEIGYMPEERGLYKKMEVGEQLLYLAQLKGMDSKDALQKIKVWMEKFEILSWWKKKIQDLSKGMQQKVQFITTVVHDPKLIILDEPFSGLDPINTNLIKDEIQELKSKGASILFSTHRMEQVEELCDDIVLINKGKIILNGDVGDIKRNYKENLFSFSFDGNLPSDINQEGFDIIEDNQKEIIVRLHEGFTPNYLLKTLMERNIEINRFNEILPSLNEIFIKKVGDSNE
jgi:ABC-2 type transport system ATP-binding protein